MKLRTLSCLVLALPLAMYGQPPSSTIDGPYQVNYASNLNLGDAVINVTNTGFSAGGDIPVVGGNSFGYMCVNAYIYAPDQEQATCCACLVSPNSLHSWPVSFGPGNLLSNVTNDAVLANIRATNSVVIKLLGTVATNAGASLGASCPSPANPNVLTTGLMAWATHAHPTNTAQAAITETPFGNASLNSGEFGKLTMDCQANLTLGSQPQCPGCRLGGLAAPSL